MSDAQRLLELIEKCVVGHGGDLGGWSRLGDDSLQLFDGRVTLRIEQKESRPSAAAAEVVHAHVLTTLHDYDDEVLDACLLGIGDDHDAALGQIAVLWTTGVAGPIKSFIDDQPVCMTCQAGVTGGDVSAGYTESDFGLPHLRAFVGPSFFRGLDDERVTSAFDDGQPWFRFAAESAAPRRVHLAKATIISKGKDGWRRELEIDGHDVSHHDPDWPAAVRGAEFGYLTRFAVFEFPIDSSVIPQREKLERTIRHFAENLPKYDSVDRLMEEMIHQGFDPGFVHDSESIATIAFGRVFFERLGVRYAPTIIRARRDGRVETDVPLMSLPAYSRARALAARLSETMPEEDFQSLCCYNAESNAILQAVEANGRGLNLADMTMYPCVVPERGTSRETMQAALATLNNLTERSRPAQKKPWWKFW